MSDATLTTTSTNRSPIANSEASPSPVTRATAHDTRNSANPVTTPAVHERHPRVTSDTNTIAHAKLITTWITSPTNTSPVALLEIVL